MGGAEVGHRSHRARRGRVDDGIGGDRDPRSVEHGAHVRLVHCHLEGCRTGPNDRALLGHRLHQGQVDLLVVEGHDLAARCEVAQLRRDQRGPQDDFGRHLAGGIVGTLGQHGHGQAEGACSLACHPCQLPRSHEPDVMRSQLARSRRPIRIDSGADTYAH